MRSALVLAALSLAAPRLASAQATAGSIQFLPDASINLAECGGSGSVNLSWTVAQATPTTIDSGKYLVFASSRAPANGTERYCDTANGTDFKAGQVGGEITAISNTQTADRPTSAFVTAAGFTCSETTTRTIHVCVHYFETGSSTPTGSAYQTLTLSVLRPPKPLAVTAEPAEQALRVRWDPGAGGEDSDGGYQVRAEAIGADPTDPGTDTRSPHYSQRIEGAEDTRLGGLVNGVRYKVTVTAFSDAGNESEPSAEAFGTPAEVADFWEYYQAQGGREQGGCASGAVGPGALLALLALGLVRRRS